MDPLTERLNDAKGDDSIDAIAERAAKVGHDIDRTTIARYVRGGRAKNPPEPVLQALAAGLGLDVRELRRLAELPHGELGPWIPPQESARLSKAQRRAFDTLIRAIATDRQEQDHERPAPITRAGESPAPDIDPNTLGLAARGGIPEGVRIREQLDRDAESPHSP